MGNLKLEQSIQPVMDQVLGYVNFATGTHDARFFSGLNELFRFFAAQPNPNGNGKSGNSLAAAKDQQLAQKVQVALEVRLQELASTNVTFRDSEQARQVLDLTFNKVLPAYRKHHRDLLFHQNDELLFNSFFLGRVFETVLQQGPAGDHGGELVNNTVAKLNNFIGHRPVATLEGQKIEPYPHEWIHPVPIFVRDAGVAVGRYCRIMESALEILRATEPDILRAAQLDPDKLDEVAIDPRAFDFDHPINKRPNHHFGQWDEHWIDGNGFYRRFIVHQVTLDSMLERVEQDSQGPTQLDRDELLYEASAVLAGTMLMAAAVSGCGPGAYDSNTTLNDLVPIIAGYRDELYRQILRQLPEKHRQRLEIEATARQQPFGAVRQDLNARLAQRRASQLVNCRLASIYARMGYPDAADKQSKVVPVAAARIICQIDCLLNAAARAIKQGNFQAALDAIPASMRRLKRGIECGAIVDPWNILGFDANYSLFPAIENSVRDHRVFDLVDLMERIFALCSRLWSEAAAQDHLEMCDSIRNEFLSIVNWWRQYAAHEVMSVDAVDAEDVFQAAELVASALNLWHKGGAAAGDIEFWAQHAEMFDSPKAYALVIDALMQRQDYSTSTALLVHWLSQAEEIPLQMADSSFHELVFHWISEQKNLFFDHDENKPPAAGNSPNEIWNRIRKFYDFMEANAEHYWSVPSFQFNQKLDFDSSDSVGFDELDELMNQDDEPESESDSEDLFRAAYDDVVYSDTADDGFEGEVFDGSLTSDDAIEAEVDRVLDRLEFLSTLASYWAIAATIPLPVVAQSEMNEQTTERLKKRRDVIGQWITQAVENRERLTDLLATVNQFPLPKGGSDHESMLHYDQLRLYKDTLLEQTIHTCIETENAIRLLLALGRAVDFLIDGRSLARTAAEQHGEIAPMNGSDPLVAVFAAILLQNATQVADHFEALIQYLHPQSLLYVPITKGGDPEAIVKARVLQIALLDLLRNLPAIGLLTETHVLTQTALAMERNNPIGSGAVTEFDELFEVAFTSMVHTLIESTNQFKSEQLVAQPDSEKDIQIAAEQILFGCTEKLTESMLILWLEHSQTLRLSVLEKVKDRNSWDRLVEFIKTYGAGLFTQHFLHLGNIRAILHQGVDHWLEQLEQSPSPPDLRLLDEIGEAIPRQKAVRYLTLVLEGVMENYNEYRDYNSTTTQSDHGEFLYTFLDFLRLRGRYDRVCWNLKPVIWAHSILVNNQENNVARRWRRSLTDRVGAEAEKYLKLMEKLRTKYSMRMESVGRRLEGRFGHQMQIDRLRALVVPAMTDPDDYESARTFELLQQEAQAFTRSTNGVGIDLPAWLAALENEVDQFQLLQRLQDSESDPPLPETAIIPIAKLQEQLEALPRKPLFE